MKIICILFDSCRGINGFTGCHYFLHQLRIPIVLDVVIGSSMEMGGNNRPPDIENMVFVSIKMNEKKGFLSAV